MALLYSMLARYPGSSDVLTDWEIVSLDDAAGLIHVAREEGRWLAQDPDFSGDRLLRLDFRLTVGEVAACRGSSYGGE